MATTKLTIKRGTRAQINAAKAANGLNQGEPYLITDEQRMEIGLSPNSSESLAKLAEVTAHTSSTANPHGVTKAQVGLGNADNTADAAKAVLSATKLATPRTINGVNFDGTANVTINATDSVARIAASEKGAANGVATLGADSKIPAAQLPSYVDDVLEFANLAAFPATGETGKIYVAADSGKIYRWSGTVYVEISATAGNADTATKLATARSISATGDASWSVSFDGSANATATLALATTGIAAGTYRSVTVDVKGRVYGGSNPTTLAGYGITDAAPAVHNHTLAQISDASAFGRSLVAAATAPAAVTLLGLDTIDGGTF